VKKTLGKDFKMSMAEEYQKLIVAAFANTFSFWAVV
jgi:hypothetical protein